MNHVTDGSWDFLPVTWVREHHTGEEEDGHCQLLQPEAVRCVERIDDPSVIDRGGDRRIGKQETADRRRVVARSRDASPGNGNRTEEEPRPSISVRIHLQPPRSNNLIDHYLSHQVSTVLPPQWSVFSGELINVFRFYIYSQLGAKNTSKTPVWCWLGVFTVTSVHFII